MVDAAPGMPDLRNRVAAPLRRHAGIVLDIMLDHALIRQWPRVCDTGRDEFGREVYASLARAEAAMPEPARRLSARLREYDLLGSCATLAGCRRTLAVIARRLRHPRPLEEGVDMLLPHLDAIDSAVHAVLARARAGMATVATA